MIAPRGLNIGKTALCKWFVNYCVFFMCFLFLISAVEIWFVFNLFAFRFSRGPFCSFWLVSILSCLFCSFCVFPLHIRFSRFPYLFAFFYLCFSVSMPFWFSKVLTQFSSHAFLKSTVLIFKSCFSFFEDARPDWGAIRKNEKKIRENNEHLVPRPFTSKLMVKRFSFFLSWKMRAPREGSPPIGAHLRQTLCSNVMIFFGNQKCRKWRWHFVGISRVCSDVFR